MGHTPPCSKKTSHFHMLDGSPCPLPMADPSFVPFPTLSTFSAIRRMDRATPCHRFSLEDHDSCPLYFFNQCASIVEVFGFQRNRLYSCVDVSPQGNYLPAVFKPVPGKCLRNQRDIDIAVIVGCSFCVRTKDEGL